MCYKCVEIDKKIVRFQDLARQVGDPKTIKSIEIRIAELEERKDALHGAQAVSTKNASEAPSW
jgi:hypothetical protein